MWNLKRSCSNVLFKVNLLAVKNVRMASKKTVTEEKSKVPKKGFFRRSESVASEEPSKTISQNSATMDQKSEGSDNKRLMRRSSMICSEGFDKYTFDTRKQNALFKSAGKEPITLPLPDEISTNQSQPVSENNALAFMQSTKPSFPEQTAVKKISAFKPLSALSISSSGKNAPLPFKRVPEETVPANMPFSYKRVPEETVPIANTYTVNNSGNTSPFTTIPLSFSSVSEEAKWAVNTNASKANPIKSSPVKNSPYSFKNVPEKNSHLAHVPEKSSRPVSKAFSFRSDQTPPLRNVSLFYNPVSEEFPPSRNTPLTAPFQNTSSYKPVSEKFPPSRNTPLTHPLQNTASYKPVSEKFPLSRNTPLTPPLQNSSSYKPVSEEFPPSKLTSLTTPIQNTSSYKPISEELLPSQNTSLTPPVRNASLSYKPVSEDFSLSRNTPLRPPLRNASLSHKPVIEEFSTSKNTPLTPPPRKASSSHKSVSEEFPPSRSTPLTNKTANELKTSKNYFSSPKPSPDEFIPSRNTPLTFTNIPKQNVSSNYISDEPIPIRNAPLSLKGESVSLRNIPSSLKHFSDESSTSTRNISSLQPVPEEPAPLRDFKNIPDEPIPFRNSPLFLKPILTKHISLLKKKTPSFKGAIIKRDSVVHPGKIDMQGSLFIDGRFQNPWPTWKPPTFANILKFGVARNKSKVPPKQELDLILPIVKQNFSKLSIPDDGIRVTWIGHSTVLVQMHGLNILTDPMFSDRASPSQVVGPKRYRDPPCTIHDLPHINAVVISHSHYDHLDHNTITLLNARFGTDIRWFVPLGLQAWMEDVGCENVVELDWWEENCVPEHSDTFFIFTPAQHWSKRTINDDNKVLWGSWCVLGPKYKFFFAGDTGYCDVFKQIGRVHGPFDLSAIPVGAYEPRWFMKYQHINPEEAVKLHIDIKSKRSLAIHWGTFSLANEYYLDPPVKLRESLDKYEIPPELFFTLKHGESRLISPNILVKKYPLNERSTKES